MFKIEVLAPSIYRRGLMKTIDAAVDAAVDAWGEALPYEISRLLRRGLQPAGSRQPANDPATIQAKAQAGQGTTPGVATGALANPRRWRVQREGRDLVLRLPRDRERIAQILEARGYDFTGIPAQALDDLEERIVAAVEEVFKT